MATAAPHGKPIYLYRLLTLTIDQGITVVRKIFDEKIPNVPLHQFLAQEETAIRDIRVITKAQLALLFPTGGRPPSTADLDLTLLVCLLRNIKACGLNKFNWKDPPQPGDLTLVADIIRLRTFRNELAHITSTREIDEVQFNNKWSDIEMVLNRLNGSLQSPDLDLQTNIDNCKNMLPDTEEQELILKQIKAMQSSLDSEVQDIRKDVDDHGIKISDHDKRINVLEIQNTK